MDHQSLLITEARSPKTLIPLFDLRNKYISIHGSVDRLRTRFRQSAFHPLNIHTLGVISVPFVDSRCTTLDIKREICIQGIPITQQTLLFGDRELQDVDVIDLLSIRRHLLRLVVSQEGLGGAVMSRGTIPFNPILDEDLLKATYGGLHCIRGGEMWIQPFGWYAYGLSVKGHSSMMIDGRSLHDMAVSYSVVDDTAISEIAMKGYTPKTLTEPQSLAADGNRIISMPDCRVAQGMAYSFTFNGRIYKTLLENRVVIMNAVSTYQMDDFHGREYWGCSASNIVPYRLLIKEIGSL